jgi:hypothetical protein
VGLGLLIMVATLTLGVALIMAADLKAGALVGAANLALRNRAPSWLRRREPRARPPGFV